MGKRSPRRQDLLPGTLEMLILKTLATGGENHGYGIAESLQTVSRHVLTVEEGSLYPALQRLLLQGLVAAAWGHSANNRRARYYRLTRAGHRALGEAASSFETMVAAIGRVMKPVPDA